MSLFDPEMTQTCSLQAPGGPDRMGAVTYAAAASSACRTWLEGKKLQLSDGEIIEYSRVLLLPETATVAVGTKVTVTGDARAYVVLRFTAVQLLDATTDHYRCYLD